MRRAINWFFLLAVIGTATIIFIVRQGTLASIRADNDQLRQQPEAPPVVEPAVVQKPPKGNVVAELTPDEQRELLRLRGQIQPLRRELAELSNQVARAEQRRTALAAAQQNAPTMTPQATAQYQAMRAEVAALIMRAEATALMQTERARNAQRVAQALSQYIKANGGNLPASLAELEQTNSTLPAGITQQFELLQGGKVRDGMDVIVAREREAATNGASGVQTRILIGSGGKIMIKQEQASDPAWQSIGAAAAESLGVRTSQPDHYTRLCFTSARQVFSFARTPKMQKESAS